MILFFGAAFLAKYAADNSLFPIELRFIALALGAFALLIVGWRLRERRAVYAQLLQGGGIAGLYLTVFAATRLYQLLPLGLAFGLLAVDRARGSGARGRAERAVARGHRHGRRLPRADPGLDRQRQPRRAVQLLRDAEPRRVRRRVVQDLARAERARLRVHVHDHRVCGAPTAIERATCARADAFLILFFLMYVGVSILNCVRQPPNLKGYVSGSLVFGLPVVAFTLHATMVSRIEYATRLERVRARRVLPAARLDVCSARGARPSACSSKRSPRSA